ncbi:hypothetical protein EYZ11_012051 [Aspergillus tanneri]|uniref:Uncharacterized protein n=1 Tax=Aspergillus tanneri TaxID=1220188 RepID=A0A4S3J1T6_9EURO|nr:uncharacterized protein ATNIH1004_006829 [Aspergillus tanneri]KAA8645410.1 hypothetical protein ATNIH1004_006829 [Aspergillus tanneri]THC88502.1 hypothetical protein EYZ11_012051 [Aspergillus tanneri]
MSSSLNPLPIAVCALDDQIGRPVSELLRPDIEVVHFIQSLEAAQQEIPHLLAGNDPQSPQVNNVGSHNYRPVRSVIFGRGFDLKDVEELRKNVAGIAPEPVIWIAGDPNRKLPPGTQPPPNYPQIVAAVASNLLNTWIEKGAAEDEVVLY